MWGEIHLILISVNCKYKKKHFFDCFQLVYLVSCLLSKLPFGKFALGELTLSPHAVSIDTGQGSDLQGMSVFASWFRNPPP